MTDQIVLDLGEYGEIIVEATSETAVQASEETEGQLVQAGLGDTVRTIKQRITVKAQDLLQLPLTGMAKLFLASLPDETEDERFRLEEFSTEFNLGIELEAGSNLGAVTLIKPTGSFKCTYTWKRKPEKATKSTRPRIPR